jgi:hypothetical protein
LNNPRQIFRSASLLTATLLSACVAYPVFEQKPNEDCKLFSRELTFRTADLTAYQKNCLYRAPDCILTAAIGSATYVASAVVTASILIVGNTIYWAERSSRCDSPPSTNSN